ncbi:helix-turn-helix domain-containing protein [Providencia rettgeri]|nr:helix-turn-helix domain-containing protein [Providencia rettgeri]
MISIGEKLKLIRESERLTSLPETAKMLGISRDALWRYESGRTVPNGDVLTNIIIHPIYEKYTLWFFTGKVASESGQIAPALYDPKNYETDEEKQA